MQALTSMSEEKLVEALRMIDEAHAQDPKMIQVDGKEQPYEFHYSQKMSNFLEKCNPSAPDTLRLAIRAQHFRRWEIPRDSYPKNKVGYHAWRTYLKKRQADMGSYIPKWIIACL